MLSIDALTLSFISACTALVASIIGPMVTLLVARRQFGATVLSANRRKWIEALRNARGARLAPRYGAGGAGGMAGRMGRV